MMRRPLLSSSCVFAAALLVGPAPAQDMNIPDFEAPDEVEILGHVRATLDGEDREWVTIYGIAGGEAGGSATWSSGLPGGLPGGSQDDAFAQMQEGGGLSPEQQAMLEMMQERLAHQRAALLQTIDVSIAGHDPASDKLLTEGVLSLQPQLVGGPEEWQANLGTPMSAEILYVIESNRGMPAVFYTTDTDMNALGEITFTDLSFEEPFGTAVGSFNARLCRVEMPSMMEVNSFPDDCLEVDGSFETELFAERY
ncbi:hypothetical protein [Aquibaculum arenosum]|uniref:DUF3299 domain-containing protein n=1 Tax=Aquibaculum arenosum TaxID=3032591 RepID=A0ABT5YNE8_9PROT|nr:hypothetical protein [Fodinicurvata sp. CAU 1616]MDF2095769.1 hypothetical protein [Fodinicurvata sp. CAU 1616]